MLGNASTHVYMEGEGERGCVKVSGREMIVEECLRVWIFEGLLLDGQRF